MRSDHLSKHLKTHQAKKSNQIQNQGETNDHVNNSTREGDLSEITAIEDHDELAINESGTGDDSALDTSVGAQM